MKVDALPIHEDVKNAIMEAIKPFGDKISAEEILAIMSKCVGMMIALQDQRKYSPHQVMAMVSANVQEGNQDMVNQLMNSQGGIQ